MTKETSARLLRAFEKHPVIAAVRSEEEALAASQSPVHAIFLLGGSILTLPRIAQVAGSTGKELFLHIDLAQGLGHDEAAVDWCRALPIRGLISTRNSLLKYASAQGLITIQRMFLVDSSSLSHGIRLLKKDMPDMVEVLPGIAPRAIRDICNEIDCPVIAGGLVTEKDEVARALMAGACAVSAGRRELWEAEL